MAPEADSSKSRASGGVVMPGRDPDDDSLLVQLSPGCIYAGGRAYEYDLPAGMSEIHRKVAEAEAAARAYDAGPADCVTVPHEPRCLHCGVVGGGHTQDCISPV